MGKSGLRKKKGNNVPVVDKSIPNANNANGVINLDSSLLLKRAHDLKAEGNKKFQSKDYAAALVHYDNALRLTPPTHLDRAVLHSNRAACLMQMKPIDYEAVIGECTVALQVQPRFIRALLRRARAFEALGKYEMSMQDVELLLCADPTHQDALDIAQRLKVALKPRLEAQPDLHSLPSPAALGASAVRGSPVVGLGNGLPARTVSKKPAASAVGGSVLLLNNNSGSNNNPEKPQPNLAAAPEPKSQLPKLVLKPSNVSSSKPILDSSKDNSKSPSLPLVSRVVTRWRPLKMVYDHDIRLAQMPVNCSFRKLREVVSKRYPSSKSVLIKYKDNDGDLVTLTSTSELKLAESFVDGLSPKESENQKSDSIALLRLYIVEVASEQEPPLLEDEEEKLVDSISVEPPSELQIVVPKEKTCLELSECKEVEMDDWLFEFAQMFRAHVGIDSDAHIDFHELGMELCSEALEETVTSSEAQPLFDKAALKFQEVAALAFFNWGNVDMCAARKRIPLDESNADKSPILSQLQAAYDWVKEKYNSASEKYEQALITKPDFYEGLLASGQQQFEMAKLHWSFALASKVDFSMWDYTETIRLFDSAEEKMKRATEMWEKMEELRGKEQKDEKIEELLLKRRKKQGSEGSGAYGRVEISASEQAEQAAIMRSQIHLFWGNMHFERSQVEFKLGMCNWSKNLDSAVQCFRLAGASEADISTVLKNHCSKEEVGKGENPNANV